LGHNAKGILVTLLPADNREIAKAAARAFGGDPRITRFWDDNRSHYVDILACVDRPHPGITSYSTVNLSDWPLEREGKEYGVRLEMVGACRSIFREFANALATSAFCIINSKWFCYPGAVFPDVLAMYDPDSPMRHFMFVPPFLWESELKTMRFASKSVAWLLAVPIYENEREYASSNGSEKLEARFVEQQIDIFDLGRSSAL
jgi:antitoxin YqcF